MCSSDILSQIPSFRCLYVKTGMFLYLPDGGGKRDISYSLGNMIEMSIKAFLAFLSSFFPAVLEKMTTFAVES